ncbi:hypothetical protein F511_32364 [Dorcoceras hygrometricum]|uniref:Uncharacterized protein n=1 Tax=Dorcoceras hygrometricum TaxID=472368 RepID=A0A2Z7DCM9_9LAMI|nr:hypothetical protein F511_32364 [Dorcoceras hygrometricum]
MEDDIQRKQQDNDKMSWLKTVISLTTKSRGGDHGDSEPSPKQNFPIPFLSPIANSVISRCSK